jgi:hemerythrin superfamily protein
MATATHSSTSKSAHKSATTSRSKTTSKKTAAGQKDAIQLLKADHREVEKLFGQFDKAKGDERRMRLCHKICMEFLVHAQIEEEIFYPACRDAMKEDDLVNEAVVEHQAAKDLISEIKGMDPADEMFAARMQVLEEQIEHHVKEEESELFPKAKKTDLDMKALGERLAARKKELMAERKGDGMEMH